MDFFTRYICINVNISAVSLIRIILSRQRISDTNFILEIGQSRSWLQLSSYRWISISLMIINNQVSGTKFKDYDRIITDYETFSRNRRTMTRVYQRGLLHPCQIAAETRWNLLGKRKKKREIVTYVSYCANLVHNTKAREEREIVKFLFESHLVFPSNGICSS